MGTQGAKYHKWIESFLERVIRIATLPSSSVM